MTGFKEIENVIKNCVGNFLLELQTSKTINEAEFERLDRASRELARMLKHEDFVPKSLLNEIYLFVKIAKAEAKYSKDRENVDKKADRIAMTFDLILLGESHEDRVPGVPRIL